MPIKMINLSWIVMFAMGSSSIVCADNTSQQVQLLNSQIQSQLQQIQDVQQKQMKDLNKQIQNQLKQMQTTLEEKIKTMNDTTQTQIKTLQTSLQQQVKQINDRVTLEKNSKVSNPK